MLNLLKNMASVCDVYLTQASRYTDVLREQDGRTTGTIEVSHLVDEVPSCGLTGFRKVRPIVQHNDGLTTVSLWIRTQALADQLYSRPLGALREPLSAIVEAMHTAAQGGDSPPTVSALLPRRPQPPAPRPPTPTAESEPPSERGSRARPDGIVTLDIESLIPEGPIDESADSADLPTSGASIGEMLSRPEDEAGVSVSHALVVVDDELPHDVTRALTSGLSALAKAAQSYTAEAATSGVDRMQIRVSSGAQGEAVCIVVRAWGGASGDSGRILGVLVIGSGATLDDSDIAILLQMIQSAAKLP